MVKINFSYKKQLIVLLFSALALWLIFDFTCLDLYLSRLFFDYQTKTWPYYSNFWTGKVGYTWIKYLLILYGIALLSLLFYSFKSSYWCTKRPALTFLLLALILVPIEISLLKHTFYKSRPEQVIEFGGTMPHVTLFEFLYNQPSASNWPGGHASGGAALLSLYFVGIQISVFWGRAGLFLGIFLSQLMGLVQVMRGQHFFSHNLWTLWFAWLTIVFIYFLYDKTNKRNNL